MTTSFHSSKCVCIEPPNSDKRLFKDVYEEINSLILDDYNLSYEFIRNYLSVGKDWMGNIVTNIYHLYTSNTFELIAINHIENIPEHFRRRYHFSFECFYDFITSSEITRQTIQIDLYPFITSSGLSRILSLKLSAEDESFSDTIPILNSTFLIEGVKLSDVIEEDLNDYGKIIFMNVKSAYYNNVRRAVGAKETKLEQFPTKIYSISELRGKIGVKSDELVYRYLFRIGAIRIKILDSIVRYYLPEEENIILPVTIPYGFYLQLKEHAII